MSEAAYAELAKFCDARMAAIAAERAALQKRQLPLYVIHPATLGANR